MNVSKTEAVEALDVIARSRDQMLTLARYDRFAPFLLVWGLVWAGANVITDLAPAWSDWGWMVGSASGLLASVLVGIRMRRSRTRTDAEGARRGPRGSSFVMLGVAICAYFPAMYAVLGPLSARQANAFISLFWAVAYMAAGAWIGWRLFAIGGIAAAAIVFGFLAIEQHYFLWMAGCGGGTLIAGGLWLRKI